MFNKTKEEQRYGRNKDTTINHAYISSGEYRKKFDEISSDKSLNRLFYYLAKEMLYHRSGTKYEDMYWIDMSSLKIVYKITDSVVEEKILYTWRIRQIVRKKRGLVTIHSHPSSFPPEIYYYLAGKYYKKYRDDYVAQMCAIVELCKSFKINFKEVLKK